MTNEKRTALKPYQQELPLVKCLRVGCQNLSVKGTCERCHAYFMSLPSDDAIAKGAVMPKAWWLL